MFVKSIVITLLFTFFCFSTIKANSPANEIEYKVKYYKAWNVKSFSCNNGNILMTYSVELPYKNTNGIFELITLEGESIFKGELGRVTNILGMIEMEKNYVFLAIAPETIIERSFYSRMPGNYQIITVNKENFEIKSADFFKYLNKRDKTIKKMVVKNPNVLSAGHQIFITNEEIIIHSIKKRHLNIITIKKNNSIKKKSIPLMDYRDRFSFSTSIFNFYKTAEKLSIYDNLSDNKVYKTDNNELIYVYKDNNERNDNNQKYGVKSINYLKVDLNNNTLEEYKFPYQNSNSDAIYYDEKLWVYGSHNNQFQLSVANPFTKEIEINYLASSPEDFLPLLAGNAADFYADKGKEIILQPSAIFDNLNSKTGKSIIGSRNWEAGMSITKHNGIYLIEIASLAVNKDIKYIWNNQHNINNFYWNKIRPTFMYDFPISLNTQNYNSWASNNELDWTTTWNRKDEKWATYFPIQLNQDLTIEKTAINQLPIESNLEIKKNIRDSIIKRYGSDKLVSAYELEHEGKTIIFYTVRGEDRSIFININD